MWHRESSNLEYRILILDLGFLSATHCQTFITHRNGSYKSGIKKIH